MAVNEDYNCLGCDAVNSDRKLSTRHIAEDNILHIDYREAVRSGNSAKEQNLQGSDDGV